MGMLLLEHHGGKMASVRGSPYLVYDAMADLKRLEHAGFMLYSSEVVCGRCYGSSELSFVNVSWVRERLLLR